MDRIAIIFNTCGIDNDNTESYLEKLKLINLQNTDGQFFYDVFVSGCAHKPGTLDKLKPVCDKVFHYPDIVPVNVTFNKTVLEVSKEKEYSGYLYIDSGISLENPYSVLRMYKLGKQFCMVSIQTDTDAGLTEWGIDVGDKKFFPMPLGKAMNLHCQLFSKYLLHHYGRIIPDIFAGHCTESTFTFLCAAIQSRWLVLNGDIVKHETSMDGMSGGFKPWEWVNRTGRPTYDHPFMIDSILHRICGEDAKEVGFGYEELRNILIHDPSKFDDYGYAKSNKLEIWLRKKLFLQEDEFNYDILKMEIV